MASTKISAVSDSHSEQKPFKKKSKKKTLSHDSSSDSDDFQPPKKTSLHSFKEDLKRTGSEVTGVSSAHKSVVTMLQDSTTLTSAMP